MTTTPPGWYDDGHGAKRWWDGNRWTEHVADAAPYASVAAPEAGAEPGPAAAADAGPTPPEPKKSRLWIVWLVLGAVLLAAVIGAAVLIPLMVVGASGQGAQAGNGTTVAEQEAAVAAVELFDEAWQNADCEAYFASTTEAFRAESGLTDCSAFESEAETFGAAVEDYEVEVTDVRTEDEDILVATTETYTALVGEDGETLDEPTEESIDWVYAVVPDGDDWVVDSMQ